MLFFFQKENGNTFTLSIILIDPQSAGINLQSPQSDSTPWTLTLIDIYNLYGTVSESIDFMIPTEL